MRILFITSNRIGDAILSTGLLSYLSQHYPMARFTIACGPLAAPLFCDMPHCDAVISLERHGRFDHWWNLWKKTYTTYWDMIVDIRGSMIAYVLRSQQRFVWRSPAHHRGHRVEQLSNLLKLAVPVSPKLMISSARLMWCKKLIQDHQHFIAFAPAANWPGKEWPLDRFMALATVLTQRGGLFEDASVLVIAAPHEYHCLQPFIDLIPPHRRLVLPSEINLLDCAAVLSHASLFIGNDSGLMHMAAAVGVPTLGLFGPSYEHLYAPYGDKARYVRTNERYEELMQRHQQDSHAPLMDSLTVEKVLQAVQSMLQQHHGL